MKKRKLMTQIGYLKMGINGLRTWAKKSNKKGL